MRPFSVKYYKEKQEHENSLSEIEQKIRKYDILYRIDTSEKNVKVLDNEKYEYEPFFE